MTFFKDTYIHNMQNYLVLITKMTAFRSFAITSISTQFFRTNKV